MAIGWDKPYELHVARMEEKKAFGGIVGGYNPSVVTAEVLASTTGVVTYPTTAVVCAIVGASTDDTAGGTGAQTVLVAGLDENWDFTTEEVELNGTTTVYTVKTFIRVFKSWVRDVGTGGVNAGNITFSLNGNIQLTLNAGIGETQEGMLSVPRGYRLYVSSIQVSGGTVNAVSAGLYTREFGKSWRSRAVTQSLGSGAPLNLKYYIRLEEKSDVQLRFRGFSASATAATGEFTFLWLTPSQEEHESELI